MTEDKIVEAVARAIARERYLEWTDHHGALRDAFAALSDEERETHIAFAVNRDWPQPITRASARAAIAAHRQALESEGMVVVPREPNEQIVDAGLDAITFDCDKARAGWELGAVYVAMIATAEKANG